MISTLKAAVITFLLLFSLAAVAHSEDREKPMMHKDMHGMGEHQMMGGGGMMGGCPMMREGMGMKEGRLAKLKADLKLTDTQTAAWDGYVSAAKARSEAMKNNRETMMKSMKTGDPVARLDAHITAMQAMLDALKALKPATDALYNVLSDDQKKKADPWLGSGGCMM